MALIKFRSPALPLPTIGYDKEHQVQLTRAIRLYFNQLDSTTPIQCDYFLAQQANGSAGYFQGNGYKLTMPYAAVSDSTDQYAAAANTDTQVAFNTADFESQAALTSNRIVVDHAGIYNFQFSLQFANTDSQIQEATVWLKKRPSGSGSSTNIPATGSKFSMHGKHGAIDGYLIAAVNFFIQLGAGDAVELWWAATAVANLSGSTTGIYIEHYNAAGTIPSIPSAVATLSFVSTV